MTTDELLSQLRNVRKSGSGFIACCPGHEDRHQSLSIATGTDGRVLLNCHAGCPTEQITAALNLTLADLMPERNEEPRGKTISATYDYVGIDGTLIFQVVRYTPKDFRQRKPDGRGGWEWRLGDTERVLYHLPQLREAIAAGRRVFVVEGEKDVLTLEAMGFAATTNAGGAGKWTDGYTKALTGAHVVILPDNDEPGRNHAKTVAAALEGKADVKIVQLPGLPEKGDTTDWANKGGTAEELKQLVMADATPRTPTLLDAIRKVARFKNEPMPPSVDFPWESINRRTRGMRPGWLCIVAGYPGSGKTACALETVFAVAKRHQKVLFNSLEMNDEELGLRMVQRWGLDTERLYRGRLTSEDRDAFDLAANFPFYENVSLISERTLSGFESQVEEHRPALVIVDYIGLMDMGRDNAQEGTTKLSRGLKAMARRYEVPVMALSQLSRPADKQKVAAPTMFDLRSSGALEADADQIIIVFREDITNANGAESEGRFIVAKSRHGHPGKPIRFTFDGERQTFLVHDESLDRAQGQGWSVLNGGRQ